MKNAFAIGDISRVMSNSCGTIENIVNGIVNSEAKETDAVMSVYKDILMNELENVQHLTISLTALVTEIIADHVNADEASGSVFAPGDLDDDLGDKTNDEVVAVEEKEEEE